MSIDVDKGTYSLYFMDGDNKSAAPERQLRKVPTRETKGKPIGKKFFDEGDYIPGRKKKQTNDFKKGEFIVMCYQPGSRGREPTYWCERLTGAMGGEREIEEFEISHVNNLISSYEN